MKSATSGTATSPVEVTNVSPHGFWLLINGRELFAPFEEFPWFENATIRQICDVTLPSPHHLYWPELDIDLAGGLGHSDAYVHVATLPALPPPPTLSRYGDAVTSIAIPLFPHFTALDGIGPYEVLQRIPEFDVTFVGRVDPVVVDRSELRDDREVAGVVGQLEVEADLEALALGHAGHPLEEGLLDLGAHVLGVVVEGGDDVMTDHGAHPTWRRPVAPE